MRWFAQFFFIFISIEVLKKKCNDSGDCPACTWGATLSFSFFLVFFFLESRRVVYLTGVYTSRKSTAILLPGSPAFLPETAVQLTFTEYFRHNSSNLKYL